jgi:hypothetical protein
LLQALLAVAHRALGAFQRVTSVQVPNHWTMAPPASRSGTIEVKKLR